MRWLELTFCWNSNCHRSRFFVWSSCVFIIASFSTSICLSFSTSGCAFIFFLDRYIHLGGNTFTDHVRSSSEKDVRSWLLSDPLSLHLDSEFSFRFAICGGCTWVAWAPILIDENWRMLSCCFPYYITVLIYHAALNALNRRILCCHRAKDKGTGHCKRWLSSNSKGIIIA